MKQRKLHSLDRVSAQRKIAAAKSNKRFMAALLNRDHRGHGEALEHWTRLHEAAFPGPSDPPGNREQLSARAASRDTDTTSVGEGHSRNDRTSVYRVQERTRLSGNRRQRADHGNRPHASARVSGESGNDEPPILNQEDERIQSIIDNTAARFEIRENPDANWSFGAWRSLHRLGWRAVRDYQTIIEREAEAQGVDANLVKAIMYVENAQSLDSQVDEGLELGLSESLLPMNIRPDPWAAIETPPAALSDPDTNIRIAVTLIRRIVDRIEDPTPAKVASIWNFTGRELVNDFGARVQDAYDRRLWALPIAPAREQEFSP